MKKTRRRWGVRDATKRLVELGASYNLTLSFDEDTKISEEIEEVTEWLVDYVEPNDE